MTSKYAVQFRIPSEFPDILKEFTREVLRAVTYEQISGTEAEIYDFATQYFDELSVKRGTRLSARQLEEMATNLFLAADADRSGALDRKEVNDIVQALAADLGLKRESDVRTVVNEVMNAADVNDNGVIEYEEFLPVAVQIVQAVYEQTMSKRDEEQAELRQLCERFFLDYDRDGSGFLDPEEFKQVFVDLSMELGLVEQVDQITQQCMDAIDTNQDGQIEYKEWLPLAMEIVQTVIDAKADAEARAAEAEAEEVLMNGMSREELEAALFELFRNADVDGSGALDGEEFENALVNSDLFGQEEINDLLASAQPAADGLIYFEEFVPHAFAILVKLVAADIQAQNARAAAAREQAARMLVHGMSKAELESTLFEVFKNADKDKSGYLDAAEFKACLDDSKLGFAGDEIQYLMDSIDVDADRRIMFEEFIPLCYDLLVELIARAIQENEARDNEEAAAMRARAEEIVGGMSKGQLESSLMEIFSAADADGSGTLDQEEFRNCLLQMEFGLSQQDVMNVIAQVDTDEDGRIRYAAFAPVAYDILVEVTARELEAQSSRRKRAEEMLQQRMNRDQLQEQLMEIFMEADADGSGSLDTEELRACLNGANLGFSEEEVDYIVAETDQNNDGGISFAEFAPLCYDMVIELIASQLKEEEMQEAANMRAQQAREMAEQMLVKGMTKEQLESTLVGIFKAADTDGSGFLGPEEFRKCLTETNIGLSDEEATKIMAQCDADGDGSISFQEFVPLAFELLVEVMAQQLVDEE